MSKLTFTEIFLKDWGNWSHSKTMAAVGADELMKSIDLFTKCQMNKLKLFNAKDTMTINE